MSVNKNILGDVRLSWASTFFFIGSATNSSLKTILPIPQSMWSLISVIVGGGILLGYVLNFKGMLKRSGKVFGKSVFIFILIYTLSAILIILRDEPLNQMLLGTALLTFVWWIPTGVMTCSVYDKSILYSVWVKASYIISGLALLMFFFHLPSETDMTQPQYNMSFGNIMILPLLFQINELTLQTHKKKKIILILLLVIFQVATILIYANRGVLLAIIFFLIYKFAFETKSRAKKLFAIVILVLAGIVLSSSIQTIAQLSVDFLALFDIESRTLDFLAEGTIDHMSGRDQIWAICFKMIEEKPILGWGLGGEYYNLGRLYGMSFDEITAQAIHPHNGIIQNFVCFGLIGGLISTLFVLLPLLHLKCKNQYKHDILLVFASSAVIPICISNGGFFISPSVAIYLYLFYRKENTYRILSNMSLCNRL